MCQAVDTDEVINLQVLQARAGAGKFPGKTNIKILLLCRISCSRVVLLMARSKAMASVLHGCKTGGKTVPNLKKAKKNKSTFSAAEIQLNLQIVKSDFELGRKRRKVASSHLERQCEIPLTINVNIDSTTTC